MSVQDKIFSSTDLITLPETTTTQGSRERYRIRVVASNRLPQFLSTEIVTRAELEHARTINRMINSDLSEESIAGFKARLKRSKVDTQTYAVIIEDSSDVDKETLSWNQDSLANLFSD